ncbi:Mechanosensitive ion channel-domain-containing protein [Thelephora terrestris]|uniref:Mechanosensitive ion channel protein n=1 Tax=Thelephora terrestris TaxID=56493 RepID=A0A9P6HQU1_9AGAM|nr:Mechanosensitive ion channel-domain-containing protein [Thelephora terrestris]
MSKNPSWDLLAGYRKFEHSYEEFDTRNASEKHLVFADGDVPNTAFVRCYHYLLNVSIITRWIIFIVPVLAILWVPGILHFTAFPNGNIWAIGLLWWSIWFSVAWVGWWVCLAFARIFPTFLRHTIGLVAVGSRRYIDWLDALNRYVALTAWTIVIWVTYQPLLNRRQSAGASDNSKAIISLIGRLLFSFFLSATVLFFEKFSIQWIAGKFHERSYAERIADQKAAVRILVTLYQYSSDIPGRTDTLRDTGVGSKRASVSATRFFKKALKGVRYAATTTTTALGNVASEITGSSVLQPNSPQAVVKTALESANKSRLLARRLFYSFAKPGVDYLLLEDIAKYFPTAEDAEAAWNLFDKDGNGDTTRDELEMTCMQCHREQLSIEHSMRDLDSAVGRLDNIFMSLYVIVVFLIIAVALEAQLLTLITGAGTIILAGLSWLIGGSLAEVLTSIIFLFIKHPYDVGDRIQVNKDAYTVKEIRLLSTIFLDGSNALVQAPNVVLNSEFIINFRRSGEMSEPFTFDVAYDTSFEQIEALRGRMIAYLSNERRDYVAVFDVTVLDIPDQEKMSLKVDIKYKSNVQQGSLKAKRKNKWICALKSALSDLEIYGPSGNPNPKPATSRYTLVPWELISEQDRTKEANSHPMPSGGMQEPRIPDSHWNFTDSNIALVDGGGDVFDEESEASDLSIFDQGVVC